MDKQTTNSIKSFFSTLVIFTSFLMPVFYLPLTREFFEFNKLLFLALITAILTVLWVVRILIDKQVEFVKSQLNLPILVFLTIFILSTVFSINKVTSLFGTYGRWFPSLFGLLVLVAFYYAIVVNVNKQETLLKTLYALIAGATISSLVMIMSYFGFYFLPASYAQLPNFNLMGSVTMVSLLAGIAVVMCLMLITNTKMLHYKMLLASTLLINFLVVLITNALVGWVVLATGILGFLLITKENKLKNTQNRIILSTTTSLALMLAVLFFLPQTKNLIQNAGFAKEISLNPTHSWKIASSTVSDYPLLGTGPSTFYLNFPKYRPLQLNNTTFWNLRFDKPFNEAFNLFGTLGILGGIAGAYLAIKALKFATHALSLKDGDETTKIIGVAIVCMLASYLVTYATVLNTFVLLLLLALQTISYASASKFGTEHIILSLSSLSGMSLLAENTNLSKKEVLQYIVALPLVLLVLAIGWYSYKMYTAEYFIRKSILAAQNNDARGIFENQQKAIQAYPLRSAYRTAFAQTNLAIATSLAQKENLTDQERTSIQSLIAQAIREVRLTTEVLNPFEVGAWETRATVYRALLNVTQDANQWALRAYNTAIQLDPTNPRLRLDMGGIYFATEDYLSAANLFRQAISLKPDYANAHYNFAQALVRLQNYDLAKREFEATLTLVAPESQDYQLVMAELESLAGLVATETAPTVEELEQQGQPTEEQEIPTEQEPLTQAGEIETIEDTGDLNLDEVNTEGNSETENQGQE